MQSNFDVIDNNKIYIYGMSHKNVHLGLIQQAKCNEANKTLIKLMSAA